MYLLYSINFEQQKRQSKFDLMPLPFDDELKENQIQMEQDEIAQMEQDVINAQKFWAEHDPFKNIKNAG